MAIPLALLAVRCRPSVGRRAARRAVHRVQPDAARVELRQGTRRAARQPRVLGAGARVPARAPRPELPRQRARHGRPLGGGVRPEAGFPITRGWYRQDDFPENEILYSDDLNRGRTCSWLHERGVRYVLVPGDRLDYSSSARPRSRPSCTLSQGAETSRSTRCRARSRSRPARRPAPDARAGDAARAQRGTLRAGDPRARDVRRAARRHVHARLLLEASSAGSSAARAALSSPRTPAYVRRLGAPRPVATPSPRPSR